MNTPEKTFSGDRFIVLVNPHPRIHGSVIDSSTRANAGSPGPYFPMGATFTKFTGLHFVYLSSIFASAAIGNPSAQSGGVDMMRSISVLASWAWSEGTSHTISS